MTTLLADSQVVLWILSDSPRLGAIARRWLTAADRVHLSAATLWELTIKSMLGKLVIPTNLSDRAKGHGLVPLDVTAADAEALGEFPELVRDDPFDRLVVAQAHRNRMQLITADRVLLALDRDFIVDATT